MGPVTRFRLTSENRYVNGHWVVSGPLTWPILDFRFPKKQKKTEENRKNRKNRKKNGRPTGRANCRAVLWPGMARTPPLPIHRSYPFLAISRSVPKTFFGRMLFVGPTSSEHRVHKGVLCHPNWKSGDSDGSPPETVSYSYTCQKSVQILSEATYFPRRIQWKKSMDLWHL